MKRTILKRGLFVFCIILFVLILVFVNGGVNVKSQDDVISRVAETIEPTPTPYGLVLIDQQFKYVNAEDKLNVRGGANDTAEIWDTLPYGTKVLASSDVINGYCLIIYTKGETDYSGYVYAEYLTEQEITPEMINSIDKSKSGEVVFEKSKSIFFKTMKIRRIYDAENQTLLYVSYATKELNGSFKHSLSTVPLYRTRAYIPSKIGQTL